MRKKKLCSVVLGVVVLLTCTFCNACKNQAYGMDADHAIQITIEELKQDPGRYEGRWITTQGYVIGQFDLITSKGYAENEQRVFLDFGDQFENERKGIMEYFGYFDMNGEIKVTGKIEARKETIEYTDELERRYYLTNIAALQLVMPEDVLIHPQPTDVALPVGVGETQETAVEVDYKELKQHAYLYDKKWITIEAYLQEDEDGMNNTLQADAKDHLPIEGIAIRSYIPEKLEEYVHKCFELTRDGKRTKVRISGYFEVNPWEMESEGADCIQILRNIYALDAIEE